MKKTVFNLETGESVEVDGIDAREYVATGGWSFEPPEPVDTDPTEVPGPQTPDADPTTPEESAGKKAKK